MAKEQCNRNDKPLVYSCSGCSSAAQMANDIALRLDRADIAEMSCIAGVGGDVPSLVKVAKSGRKIIALDGCILECAKSCLKRQDVEPDIHHVLAEYGIKKRKHQTYDKKEADVVYRSVVNSITETWFQDKSKGE